MKKFLKCVLSVALVCVVALSFAGCKTKLSSTSVSTEKVKVVNGVSTNGGTTVIYNNYLYFINGTKTNDGTSSTDNVRSGVYRVSYNSETGEVGDNYEVVVKDLVGFEGGSLYFFGDFMYYATPSADVNYKGDTLYYKTKFMRYDLVYNKSHEIYTTKQNSSDESLAYAYYVVGDSLNLVVYESTNSSITSLKIGDEVKTNYVIEDVDTCVMSENNGTCVTEGKTTDANNFVFYTKAHDESDRIQTGVKVYRTSPASNNSYLIGDNGEDISLLSIRNGKLIYSANELIYEQVISGTTSDVIASDISNIISYETFDNVIFMENEDGTISVLYYYADKDKSIYQVGVVDCTNGLNPVNTLITSLNKSEAFEFIGTTVINETITEDDETTENEDETVKQNVMYLLYIDTKVAYKLEIAREVDGKMVYSKHTEPVKLSTSEVSSASGLIVAEVIGEKLYIMATVDSETYLHEIDLTVDEDSTKKATMIGVKE